MAHKLTWPLIVIGLCFYVSFTPGCNTMEGFGEDLEAGGEALSDKARQEKYDD